MKVRKVCLVGKYKKAKALCYIVEISLYNN